MTLASHMPTVTAVVVEASIEACWTGNDSDRVLSRLSWSLASPRSKPRILVNDLSTRRRALGVGVGGPS